MLSVVYSRSISVLCAVFCFSLFCFVQLIFFLSGAPLPQPYSLLNQRMHCTAAAICLERNATSEESTSDVVHTCIFAALPCHESIILARVFLFFRKNNTTII